MAVYTWIVIYHSVLIILHSSLLFRVMDGASLNSKSTTEMALNVSVNPDDLTTTLTNLSTDIHKPGDYPRQERSVNEFHRVKGTRKYIMNRASNQYMQILKNGTVRTTFKEEPYRLFEFVTFSVVSPRILLATVPDILSTKGRKSKGDRSKNKKFKHSIKAVESEMYLCMNEKGNLYGQRNATEECFFYEVRFSQETFYEQFISVKYPEKNKKKMWFVAFNDDGKSRPGKRTHRNQHSAMFLLQKYPHSVKPTIKLEGTKMGSTKTTTSKPQSGRRRNRGRGRRRNGKRKRPNRRRGRRRGGNRGGSRFNLLGHSGRSSRRTRRRSRSRGRRTQL